MAVFLLNDFDYVVQALFAEQANKALITHTRVRAGDRGPAEPTKFERLAAIWERLLPDRRLVITGDDIQVKIPGALATYPAADMSDGERAIFYMIGQALVASEGTVLIVDEPELHVHRSIMSKLWDELEGARPDCAFVFITHDLEFAAARVAQKFVIRDYVPTPQWTVESVPVDTPFSEEITTLILGSRRPILFIEGDENSLDCAIYRGCFSEWTLIPRGSCEQVVHSVVTMRRNKEFTRVTCAGIVDADGYDPAEVEHLLKLGVVTLPVSEIENVLLLPPVSRAIGESEAFEGLELVKRLEALKADIFETLSSVDAIEKVVARYCRRRIDRTLKKIDLSNASTAADISLEYQKQTSMLDVAAMAQQARDRINAAIAGDDLPLLLKNYDNKALLHLVPKHLKPSRLPDFESWLTRVLRSNKVPALTEALRAVLPEINAG
jgi:AAA domain, putative AbiEii toxin, Type IV TA system